jgi:hypothetical protein
MGRGDGRRADLALVSYDQRGGHDVKNQTTTEAKPARPPSQPSTNGSIDTVTLELLARWREEDAHASPEQIRAAEEELREFKRAMNENRSSAGEPVLCP